jgi:hypothetical protein
LRRVDEVPDGVEDFDNEDDRVDDRDGKADAGRGFRDFCGSSGFKLEAG